MCAVGEHKPVSRSITTGRSNLTSLKLFSHRLRHAVACPDHIQCFSGSSLQEPPLRFLELQSCIGMPGLASLKFDLGSATRPLRLFGRVGSPLLGSPACGRLQRGKGGPHFGHWRQLMSCELFLGGSWMQSCGRRWRSCCCTRVIRRCL